MRRIARVSAPPLVRVLSQSSVGWAHDRDDDHHGHWFTAWAQSIGHRMGTAFTGANAAPDVSHTALRMIVRPSISGEAIRVRIENTQAQTPVTFSAAYIGKLGTGAALVPGSNR